MKRKSEFYIDIEDELRKKAKKNYCGQFKGQTSTKSQIAIIEEHFSNQIENQTENQVPHDKREKSRLELKAILSQN